MSFNIVTTTTARFDIQDAIDWENKRHPGLADRFLEDLERKLFTVAAMPYGYRVRYADVRCACTDVFSYLIHYTIDDANHQIIVLQVLHTSRKPIW